MILIGTHVDHASANAFFVILEKKLKNVRHYYTIRSACRAPVTTCPEKLAALYHDKAFTVRKRIYSQDRRPKKDVSARPTIVMAAGTGDSALVSTLRDRDLPVEAVFLNGNFGREVDRAGIGKNHAATAEEIYETMGRVRTQKRLAPMPATEDSLTLLKELDRILGTEEYGTPLLLATAVPIWFRENVRYSSAYRTSSTSIRNYR